MESAFLCRMGLEPRVKATGTVLTNFECRTAVIRVADSVVQSAKCWKAVIVTRLKVLQ